MSWNDFEKRQIDADTIELVCSGCGSADLRVRQELPKRSGGKHRTRVAAFCPRCDCDFRLKLGTFENPRD